ncbi:MAG: GNAT family N-acetyltransferase [Verrucomicrobiota bacterium JB022]|nr:GNAT family N-acetyltransferase [Verrucomicrobiota bacterium JB022]
MPISVQLPPPPDWRDILRPGSRLFLGSGAACPHALMDQLLQQERYFNDLQLHQTLTLGPAPWTERAPSRQFSVNAFVLDPRLSDLVNAGQDDYTPAHSSEIPQMLEEGIIAMDTALIMVSPPDAYGYCSLGPSVGLLPAVLRVARRVVAQINPRMPRVGGLAHVPVSSLHYAIQHEAPLPELPAPEQTPAHRQIGYFAAQLIDDGDTIQTGVGAVGNAALQALRQHRHLGFHSELMGDAARELFEQGVIDNSRKRLLPGKLVATALLGSQALYDFADGNLHLDLRSAEFVNHPQNIARNDRVVAVNSALLVDLTGQVAMDSVQGKFRAGIGSQIDFIRGAAMSRRGRPIIALPSTWVDDQGQRRSRIVAQMPPGAGVGINRADIHYVITEYGIATLRGRSIQERVQELIEIAHPDFREELLRDARQHNFVPPYFQLSPPVAEHDSSLLQRSKLRLRDGIDYVLRLLNPSDGRRLQEFFYSHTEETILRRYGFTVTRMTRERAFELVGVDQNRDLALGLFELQGPRQVIHAVGRYYLERDGLSAEMAFVVREKKRRLGMARLLIERLIAVAKSRGLHKLWARVDRDNEAMLALFRRFGAREVPGESLDELRVEIPLTSGDAQPPAKPDYIRHK